MRRQTYHGDGLGSFLKGAVRGVKKIAQSDIGKAVISVARPLVKRQIERQLGKRNIRVNLGNGLRLAGQGKTRRRRAPRRRAIPKQTIYL